MSTSEHGAPRQDFERAGRDGALALAARSLADAGAAARRLLEVHADRARLSTRRALVALVAAGTATVFLAVAAGGAALVLLDGLCAGLTELWGGRAWLGDLSGGLLTVAATATLLGLANRLADRAALSNLRAKYADDTDPNQPSAPPDPTHRANGR